MQQLFAIPDVISRRAVDGHVWFQDFIVPEGQAYDMTESADVAIVLTDSRDNGDVLFTCSADNNEAYVYTPEHYRFGLPVTGYRPFAFGSACSIDLAASSADHGNAVFGFIEDAGENILLDDEGGPKGSVAQALIWKLGGETNWRCGACDYDETNPAHKTVNAAGRLNEKTSSYQSLMITVTPRGAELIVAYFYDPRGLGGFEPLIDERNKPITDVIRSPTSNRDMSLVVGVKQASSTALADHCDWVSAWMGRNRDKVL